MDFHVCVCAQEGDFSLFLVIVSFFFVYDVVTVNKLVALISICQFDHRPI